MKKIAMIAVLFAVAFATVGCGGTPSTKAPAAGGTPSSKM